MTTSIIRINFLAAVWISIGMGAVIVYMSWPPGAADRYSPQKAGVVFGLLMTSLQFLLWRIYYRHDERPWVAAVMGAYLLLPVLVARLGDEVNGISIVTSPATYVLVYLGLSHLVYSAWRWRISTRSWLDI